MNKRRFIIFPLSVNQGTMLTTVKVIGVIASLLSLNLMTNTTLAILPVALLIAAGILGSLLALIIFHYGSRKMGHLIGIGVGTFGLIVSIIAIVHKSFIIFKILIVIHTLSPANNRSFVC